MGKEQKAVGCQEGGVGERGTRVVHGDMRSLPGGTDRRGAEPETQKAEYPGCHVSPRIHRAFSLKPTSFSHIPTSQSSHRQTKNIRIVIVQPATKTGLLFFVLFLKQHQARLQQARLQ